MTALSIHLPEKIAEASKQVAEQLGMSRTEFIRQAVVHEIQHFYVQQEKNAMVKSILAMKKNTSYLKETQEIDNEFSDLPPDEGDSWWKKS